MFVYVQFILALCYMTYTCIHIYVMSTYICILIYIYIYYITTIYYSKTHILLPRLFAKIGTNMIYLYDIYIFFTTIHMISKTHICSPSIFAKMWPTWNIYVCLTYIYIYYFIFVIQLPMHLSRITATTGIFQACSESGWCVFLAGTH